MHSDLSYRFQDPSLERPTLSVTLSLGQVYIYTHTRVRSKRNSIYSRLLYT